MSAAILKILHPFKHPELRVMSSEQTKNSLTDSPPCLLAEMAIVASLVSRASKMLYKRPGAEAVYIASYKEPLDQLDCWKLFVQL